MESEQHTIIVPLPAEAPVPEEALAATPLGDDANGTSRWRLEAAPFVSYEVACGDEVRCRTDEQGRPVFQAVLRASGHLTARVLLHADLDLMGRMRALMRLKELGGRAEEPRGRYYAIDLAPHVDIEAFASALDELAEVGSLEFEIVEPTDGDGAVPKR